MALDWQHFLDVPQVAGADGPVAADAHLAEFEAGETAGATQGEQPIGR